MKKSENFEFMLPENSDNSSLDYFNNNFKIIDKNLKQALNPATQIVPNMIKIKNINDGENITTIISCEGMRYCGRNYSFSQLSFEKGLLNSNSTYYIKATEVQNPNSEQIGVLSAKLAVVEYDGDLENISDSFILASFSTDLNALYLDESLSYFPSSYVDDLFNQYKEKLENNESNIQRLIEDNENKVKVSDVIIPIGLPKNDKTNKTLTFPNYVFNGEYRTLSNSTISYSDFEDGDTYNVIVNGSNIELSEYDQNILGGSENYCRIRYFAEDNSFAYLFYCNSAFTEGIGVELMKKADKSELEELKDGMTETKSQPQHINSWIDWTSASTPKIRVSCYIKGIYNDSKYWLISDNLLSKDGAHRVYLNRNGDDWVLSENRLMTAYDTIPVCYYNVKDGKVVDFAKFDSENLIENYFHPMNEAIANNKLAIKTNTANIKQLETDKANASDVSQNYSNAALKTVSGKSIAIDDISPIQHTVNIKGEANSNVNVYGRNIFNIFLQENKPNVDTPLYVEDDGTISRVNLKNVSVNTTWLTYNSNDYASVKAGKSYVLSCLLNGSTVTTAFATVKYADETEETFAVDVPFTPTQDGIVINVKSSVNVALPANQTSKIRIMLTMTDNKNFKYNRYKAESFYETYKPKQSITLDENGNSTCNSVYPHLYIDSDSKVDVTYNVNILYPTVKLSGEFGGIYNGGTISTTVFESLTDLYSAYDNLLGTSNRKLIGYGSTVNGERDTALPIYEYTLQNPLGKTVDIISAPTLLITSGIHSDEKTAIMATYRFIEQLKNGSNDNAKAIRDALTIKIVPCVNPWGYDNTTTNNEGRCNARGVNLNRNFGYNWSDYVVSSSNNNKGTKAYSELETQALRDWLQENTNAIAHIDMHNHGSGDYYSFCYIATNCWQHRKIFSAMIRKILAPFQSNRKINLANTKHFVEDNTIAGIASEAWYFNNINSSIIEVPYGTRGAVVNGARIPAEVDILGNFIIEILNNTRY